MQSYDILTIFRRCMVLLNAVICAVVTWIFISTPKYAAQNADGIQFSGLISTLPSPPWTFMFGLLGLLALVFVDAAYKRSETESPMLCWIEISLCLVTISALHFDYNGLLLLVVVNLIDRLNGTRRELFLFGMAMLYLVTSLDFLQTLMKLAPISEYLLYYSLEIRQNIQSLIAFLNALNLIIFVIYMAVLIGQRTEENAKVRKLNRELEQANNKLSELNIRLKEYAEQSAHAAETRERNRLAREIHDTLGHALTGITAGADACIQMLDTSPGLAKKQMELIAATARNGMNEVRRSVKALRPDAVERLQLPNALRKLCEDMRAASGAEIFLDICSDTLRLSQDEEDTIYRIAQEGITNAIRHGMATKIWVELTLSGRTLAVSVSDNGSGCGKIKEGFGLLHMRERLRMLGGTLHIDGTSGFLIEADIPLRWGDEL